jgi:hypothetical protein
MTGAFSIRRQAAKEGNGAMEQSDSGTLNVLAAAAPLVI